MSGFILKQSLCPFRSHLYPPKDCWTSLKDRYWAVLEKSFKNKAYPVTYVRKIQKNIGALLFEMGKGDLYSDIALVI